MVRRKDRVWWLQQWNYNMIERHLMVMENSFWKYWRNIWLFSLVPSPVSGTEVTNKDYVDALVNTNVTAIENNNQRLHSLESSAPQWGVNETAIENNNQRLHSLESSAPQWGVNETAIENNQRLYSLESSAPQWGVNETAIANAQTAIKKIYSL